MQITINTAEILGNEETIREEVIREVSSALILDMRQQSKQALAEMLNNNLRSTVQQITSEAIAIAIDTEFTDMDEYGRPGRTATLRARIADVVQSQCTFKNKGYVIENNVFTNIVNTVVADEVRKFESSFQSLVTKQVVEQSMDMAVKTLRKSLGIVP